MSTSNQFLIHIGNASLVKIPSEPSRRKSRWLDFRRVGAITRGSRRRSILTRCGSVRDNLGLVPTSRPKDHYNWLLASQASLGTVYSSALLGCSLTERDCGMYGELFG